MSEQRKREAGFRILEDAGLKYRQYAPPAYRLLWKLGLDVRPPHYNSFLANALTIGSIGGFVFGILFPFLMYFVTDMPLIAVFVVFNIVSFGVLFGIGMALALKLKVRKLDLPHWEDIPPS